MKASTGYVLFMGTAALSFLITGVHQLVIFLIRRRWPEVRGTILDASTIQTRDTDSVGWNSYQHNVSYRYNERQYGVVLQNPSSKLGTVSLRVNPASPDKAYNDDGRRLLYSVLFMIGGVVLVFALISTMV
jgi:hypothetical protein